MYMSTKKRKKLGVGKGSHLELGIGLDSRDEHPVEREERAHNEQGMWD